MKSTIAGLLLLALPGLGAAAPTYAVIGQPDLASTSLATRCADANARFHQAVDGGFEMKGPAAVAVDHTSRLFVADYGGRRVLVFDLDDLGVCPVATGVIGAGELAGPESLAWDAQTGTLFVADTLDQTVAGYRFSNGAWTRRFTLGVSGAPGDAFDRFEFPRGLAVDPGGRLFVADDGNSRVLVFDPPFTSGEPAADSIHASADGGFSGVKAVAMIGHTLFVADYFGNRVLRFTGPFQTPDQTYVASGIFTGVSQPVDLAVHPDGSLLVTDQGNVRTARYDDAAFRAAANAPTSTFARYLHAEPLGVAAARDDRIFIADYSAYRVLVRREKRLAAPVDRSATAAVRNLLEDLHDRPARDAGRVAVGQQLLSWAYGSKDDPAAWYGDWLQMEQRGFRLPRIMGAELSDLMSYAGFSPNQDALDELIRFGQAGGIVALVWHPSRPSAGAFGSPAPTSTLAAMIDDGSAIGQAWQVQLDRAAAVLQQFEDAGVAVLFRPLHEQNGNFFWWGHDGSNGGALRSRQRAWVNVWRDLVREMTVTRDLHNLAFVFGTNQVNFAGVAPPLTYYPGGAWADVASIDVYDEALDLAGDSRGLRHYQALTGTGKPFGLAEFGQSFGGAGTGPDAAAWDARTLARRVRDSYPRLAFAIAWYSSVEGGNPFVFAIPDVSFGKALLKNPLMDAGP
ncbi:MAG TPA: glycosyl hydrolase [Nevskiaceae bacterium]|nr:glycosyl hydrolase [Nevskiaceae bacterium]